MWLPKSQPDKKDGVNGLVAVAIDKEKGSQNALKWAIDHLLSKSATVILIHVKLNSSSSPFPFTQSEYTLYMLFVEKMLKCQKFSTKFICQYDMICLRTLERISRSCMSFPSNN